MADYIFDWWFEDDIKDEKVANQQQYEWPFASEEFIRYWSVGVRDDGNDNGFWVPFRRWFVHVFISFDIGFSVYFYHKYWLILIFRWAHFILRVLIKTQTVHIKHPCNNVLDCCFLLILWIYQFITRPDSCNW